jgi:hypothetical protein
MNVVDIMRPSLRWLHSAFARPQIYTPNNGVGVTLAAWVRGVRDEDLFAAAIQGDKAAVIDAQAFKDATGQPHPLRYDRLRITGGSSFSVEAWRGSPDDDAPVFFKLLLRGGSQ